MCVKHLILCSSIEGACGKVSDLSLSLFQIEEEFQRIMLRPLQSTFLSRLDQYTPKLLILYRNKGGVVHRNHDNTLDLLNEACTYNNLALALLWCTV